LQILKANIDHSDLIIELGRQTFIESHGHSASIEDITCFNNKTYNKEILQKEFQDPNIQYHIIYYRGKAAGFSKIESYASNKYIKDIDVSKLDRIYLLTEFYHLGLGSKLLEYNIKLSKKEIQKGIWLAVWTENARAIKFYCKMGFKILGAHSYEISPTHSNPNHIMYLEY